MIELPTSFTTKAARLTRLGITGLRVTPEYFIRQEANRKAVFVGGLWDENTIPEEDAVIKHYRITTTLSETLSRKPQRKKHVQAA